MLRDRLARRGARATLGVMLITAAFTLPAGAMHASNVRASAPSSIDRTLPTLPLGSTARGRAGAEHSALTLAASLKALPVDDSGTLCPADHLVVTWRTPDGTYQHGAYIEPVGPTPTVATTTVNGVVVCDGSRYAYMGFEAHWTGARWTVEDVPAPADEDEPAPGAPAVADGQPAPAPPAATPAEPPSDLTPAATDGSIEGYAAYQPQQSCDPTAKKGTLALRDTLLKTYPGSRNLGISRACSAGGRSEHKEGRAFDWGVNVNNPAQKAQAENFIGRLFATDDHGNRHALARRLGVMYVIWNRRIWSAYRVNDGWRPYSGASAHTDHVHISLSWAGGRGQTSYWTGHPADLSQVTPDLELAAAQASPSGSKAKKAKVTPRPKAAADNTGDDAARAARKAERDARRAAEAAQRKAEWDAKRAAAQQEWEAQREARRAAEQQRRAEWEAQRAAQAEARRQAEQQRQQERQAAEAARRADWERQRAEAEAARQAAREAARAAELERRRAAEQQRQAELEQQRQARRAERRQRSTTTTVATPTTAATADTTP